MAAIFFGTSSFDGRKRQMARSEEKPGELFIGTGRMAIPATCKAKGEGSVLQLLFLNEQVHIGNRRYGLFFPEFYDLFHQAVERKGKISGGTIGVSIQ